MAISPDQIIVLFNERLAGKGRIRPCPSFFLPMTIAQDFITMRNYPKFDLIETWEEYFDMVAASSFLTTQFTPSLAWLLKPENAFKVFSGQYDNKNIPLPEKNAKNDYYQAQAMASEMFNRIVMAGNSDLMRVIGQFSELEKAAMEKFGRASEILNCNDYQASEIKKRLTTAFLDCITH